MEPKATQQLVFTAIANGDWDAAENHLNDLLDWINKDGFSPDLAGLDHSTRVDFYRRLLAMVEEQ